MAAGQGDLLAAILAAERARVAAARAAAPEAELRRRAAERSRRDFAAALGAGPRPRVIAEMKQASPSAGVLRAGFDPAALAAGYAAAGAAALSVLTEEPHFGGRLAHLEQARAACALPILRKDFIVEEYQIWESAAHGADAVLLIVAALAPARLDALLAAARRAELAALVEVHDRTELRRAAEAGAAIIGVNNRNLRSLEVDAGLAPALAGAIPAAALKVAESGLRAAADLRRAGAAGYDAVLIGERLLREPDPGAALGRLLAELHAA